MSNLDGQLRVMESLPGDKHLIWDSDRELWEVVIQIEGIEYVAHNRELHLAMHDASLRALISSPIVGRSPKKLRIATRRF